MTASPFPFVVGSGRSGTTLLRVMLDAHPALAIPHESYFIEQLARRADRFRSHGAFDAKAFERELFRDARFQHWGLAPAAVSQRLDEDAPADLAAAIRAVYGAYAHAQGKPRYGDKTPSYAMSVQRIADLLPEAVFIHLVRDPRDVAASYRRTSFGPSTVLGAAARWQLLTETARRAGRPLGRDRYLEVRYETLVSSPEAVLAQVCELVELPYDASMLAYQDSDAARDAAQHDDGQHAGVRLAPTPSLRDWHDDLTSDEVATVESVTGSLLDELGYERSGSSGGSHPARVAAARALVRLSLAVRRTRALNHMRGSYRRLRGRTH